MKHRLLAPLAFLIAISTFALAFFVPMTNAAPGPGQWCDSGSSVVNCYFWLWENVPQHGGSVVMTVPSQNDRILRCSPTPGGKCSVSSDGLQATFTCPDHGGCKNGEEFGDVVQLNATAQSGIGTVLSQLAYQASNVGSLALWFPGLWMGGGGYGEYSPNTGDYGVPIP
jgi:hypothetical protein